MHKTPFKFVLGLSAALLLAACGGDEQIKDENEAAAKLYQEAKKALMSHNWDLAIQRYKLLRSRFPFGRYAEQGQLDLAYAYHEAGQPENVTSELDRFIRTFPTHPNVDYAYYLRGLTHYEQNMGLFAKMFPARMATREQTTFRQAFQDFSELLRRYPESRYAPDARQRMVFLRNLLAQHEIEVANYYMRRNAYIAAVNRADYVLETYPQSPANADALAIQVQAYKELGMDELAQDAERVLKMNYPDHAYLTGKDGGGFWDALWVFD